MEYQAYWKFEHLKDKTAEDKNNKEKKFFHE